MNDLSARDLHEFRVWRREDLNLVSERTQMATLRVFMEWCETIDDYRPDAETPHLDIHHRPETDTPIKNGVRGERPVAISSEVCDVIEDYLQHQRPDVTDE